MNNSPELALIKSHYSKMRMLYLIGIGLSLIGVGMYLWLHNTAAASGWLASASAYGASFLIAINTERAELIKELSKPRGEG